MVNRRNGRKHHKFETDKNKSLLTCLCCLIQFPKESPVISTARNGFKNTRFLAFDIVHAVEFSRIGRSQFSPHRPKRPHHGCYSGPIKKAERNRPIKTFVSGAFAPGNLSNLPPSRQESNQPSRLKTSEKSQQNKPKQQQTRTIQNTQKPQNNNRKTVTVETLSLPLHEVLSVKRSANLRGDKKEDYV